MVSSPTGSDYKVVALEREESGILLNNSEAHLPIMKSFPLPGIPGIALPKPREQNHDVGTWISGLRTSALNFLGCKAPCPCSHRNDLGVLWTPHNSPRTDDVVGLVGDLEQDWHLQMPLIQAPREFAMSSPVRISMRVVDGDALGLIGRTERVSDREVADEKFSQGFSSPEKKISEKGSDMSSPGRIHRRPLKRPEIE